MLYCFIYYLLEFLFYYAYLTPIKIRSLFISLPLIFAPLESNLLPLIFAPLIDLLFFFPSHQSKRKFQGTYEIQNGYPKVINFCGINSAHFFKFCNTFFQILQISMTYSLPLIFAHPYFRCPIRSL